MRRTFQILLLAVAFIPFVLGGMTLVVGAARFVPTENVTAELDNQMRFSAVRSMLPFVLTVWIVLNLDRAGSVLSIVLWATAAGGAARILSVLQYGAPSTATIGVIVLEIGVLAFLPWHRTIVRRSEEYVDRGKTLAGTRDKGVNDEQS